MSENPLFYKNVVALDRERHGGLKMDVSISRFGFAAGAHVAPAVMEEFEAGGRHLPIVFLPGVDAPSAVFLMGLTPGKNQFVGADGVWKGDYIPAYVRRYPFIIGEVANSEPLVCIDESYEGFKRPNGEPLFVNNEQTPALQINIQFIKDYLTAAKATEGFIAALRRLDLFRSVTIDVQRDQKDRSTVHGFLTVDVAKLNALPDADFLELRKNGHLAPIYAHLGSLNELRRLNG